MHSSHKTINVKAQTNKQTKTRGRTIEGDIEHRPLTSTHMYAHPHINSTNMDIFHMNIVQTTFLKIAEVNKFKTKLILIY